MERDTDFKKNSDKQTMSLFLSLYLIILVFLIALLSVSSFKGLRFDVGSKSVRDSFKNHFKAKAKEIRFAEGNNDGFLIHTEEKNKNLPYEGNVFLRELPMVKMIESESGKIMYADLKRDDIFLNDEIYEDKKAFFKQLSENMQNHPDNKHYELKFVFGESYTDGLYPVIADKNYRQAAALARIMSEYGADAENISVGVDAVDYDKIRLFFSVIDDE